MTKQAAIVSAYGNLCLPSLRHLTLHHNWPIVNGIVILDTDISPSTIVNTWNMPNLQTLHADAGFQHLHLSRTLDAIAFDVTRNAGDEFTFTVGTLIQYLRSSALSNIRMLRLHSRRHCDWDVIQLEENAPSLGPVTFMQLQELSFSDTEANFMSPIFPQRSFETVILLLHAPNVATITVDLFAGRGLSVIDASLHFFDVGHHEHPQKNGYNV